MKNARQTDSRQATLGIQRWAWSAVVALLLSTMAGVGSIRAQEAPQANTGEETASDALVQPAVQDDASQPHKPRFRDRFFDAQDGYLDFSTILANGGFIPVPIIITEPAVGGGGGVAAAFLSSSPDHPRQITRRVLAAFKTGNGSSGVGYLQSGYAMDGRLSYRFAIGRGKVTLDSYPGFAPEGIEYTSRYDYGVVGSAQWRFSDDRISFGPLFDFRKLRSTLDVQGLPDAFAGEFGQDMQTGALGLGLHFDSRDNPLTPTKGVNALAEAKYNRDAFGSDRDYEEYAGSAYVFGEASQRLHYGVKFEADAIRGDFPIYYAPAVNLRGTPAARYQGMNTYASEAEVTWRKDERWAFLAFAGVSFADARSSRIYKDSGALYTGGVGFRYRIARQFGLDAGVDVAYGSDGVVFYLQFGHAWSFGMD
ncbi:MULTISPECIES: hypothetical protein [unclassified Brevundimonas]|uniref:hypothetical protein n=1 Tax=unclassified Brevundimonas TaxID=2622653 RepID=UPI0025C10344|nr:MULTISPECIES: hypothetical protein [unclassified Brevundimonas]